MNPFLPPIEQDYFTVDGFELESGIHLKEVTVAYKTWGELNGARDNVMIICHAFTGSANVEDWWGPLMGPGRAFDPTKYFIFCGNVMGSPYGTCSPISTNPDTGQPYGPEFPLTTIRDDIRLHKLVLDHLRVSSVAVAIGGSMGGMAVLEWPLCTPPGFVRRIIPLATAARHSAWCISWGEAQRQSIYSDPAYMDGYYDRQRPPKFGLAAARMSALLTYRSRDSFESRFGRKVQTSNTNTLISSPPKTPSEASLAIHNDGHRSSRPGTPRTSSSSPTSEIQPSKIFSAQSYLRYQGDKFTARFDANCYIHITRKMDTHDVARGRTDIDGDGPDDLARALARLPQHALVIGIQTDGLFLLSEQRELAAHIPGSELVIIDSPDGHDGFLLEFEQINRHVVCYLQEEIPGLYRGSEEVAPVDFAVKQTSIFGEAESGLDVTRW